MVYNIFIIPVTIKGNTHLYIAILYESLTGIKPEAIFPVHLNAF